MCDILPIGFTNLQTILHINSKHCEYSLACRQQLKRPTESDTQLLWEFAFHLPFGRLMSAWAFPSAWSSGRFRTRTRSCGRLIKHQLFYIFKVIYSVSIEVYHFCDCNSINNIVLYYSTLYSEHTLNIWSLHLINKHKYLYRYIRNFWYL